ncbi:MAG: hypothetical protein KGH49_00205 [Candidatus Micrarchaeota archaeon]|nr:hypothetical protein [Candidatus Micrarchaeota archaeon]
MVSASEVVDEHFGMISSNVATKIAEDRTMAAGADTMPQSPKATTIKIEDLIRERVRVETLVDIEEYVYRVYNTREVEIGGVNIPIRVVVLGTQGENARMILFQHKLDLANTVPIERGDRILARKFLVKRGYNGFELSSIAHSTIERTYAANSGINDFSLLDGQREVDVIGRIVSIGRVNHSIFSISRDNDSCNFTITDGPSTIKVSVIGNAVRDIVIAHPGDPVKIEFAQVRQGNGKSELYLNESSRILVGESLRARLRH